MTTISEIVKPISYTIQQANVEDIPRIVHLINKAFWPSHSTFLQDTPESYQRVSEGYIASLISAKTDRLFTLKDKVADLVIGTILLQTVVPNADKKAKFGLLAKDLSPDYNSWCIGTILMDYVFEHTRELEKEKLVIEVVSSLGTLIGYYERNGFEKTGIKTPFPRAQCLKPNLDVHLVEMEVALTSLSAQL